jgi:hypothetical protein
MRREKRTAPATIRRGDRFDDLTTTTRAVTHDGE